MVELANRTHHQSLDAAICAAISILEIVFPGRIKAYYLTGSYAEGTAVNTSDADVLAVFKAAATQQEKDTVFDLADHLSQIGARFLDLEGIGEDEVARRSGQLKHKSLFLFGEDLASGLPELPLGEQIQAALKSALFFMGQVARGTQNLSYPIEFPDPSAEFYVYDIDPIEGKRDTKVLMAIIGWMATAYFSPGG